MALDDVNPLTGEASSDIYVRGYVKGPGEDQQETDIHYRYNAACRSLHIRRRS